MAPFSTDSDEVEGASSRRCFHQVASPFRAAIAKCAEIAPCKVAPVQANCINRWESVSILGCLWFASGTGHSLNGTQIFMARY